MTPQQRLLVTFYSILALIALVATWGQNVAYFGAVGDTLGAFARFIEDTRANPASRSITVDIGLFLLAASAFMVIEARRLGVRFVWLYLAAGFLIAISVAFPLFMIAREFRLARGGAEASWRLTAVDVFGLAVVTALIAGLSVRALT